MHSSHSGCAAHTVFPLLYFIVSEFFAHLVSPLFRVSHCAVYVLLLGECPYVNVSQ